MNCSLSASRPLLIKYRLINSCSSNWIDAPEREHKFSNEIQVIPNLSRWFAALITHNRTSTDERQPIARLASNSGFIVTSAAHFSIVSTLKRYISMHNNSVRTAVEERFGVTCTASKSPSYTTVQNNCDSLSTNDVRSRAKTSYRNGLDLSRWFRRQCGNAGCKCCQWIVC